MKTSLTMEYDGIVIKPYTLKRHLPVIGARNGHFYTSKQVEIIFSRIGWPPGSDYAKLLEVA